MAITASQESALYRKVLMEKYLDIALEHAWLGWGRNTWPKVDGMESIDNYYLLLSLMHGLPASALLLALMLWMAVRLLRQGLTEPSGHNSLSFCFLGMIISVIVSLATVYLGENVLPALFFVLGWAEGFLHDPASDPGRASVNAPLAPPARFRRVMA
jgi:heme A synthase